MLQGAWTAEAARAISNEFDAQGLDVLCSHEDRRARNATSRVKTGRIISWINPEMKPSTELAFPDIAIVDRTTKKVILLVEVEESKPQPKLVIADILANLLGDHITFGPNQKDELLVGPWTTFSLLAKSTGKGSGDQQLRMLEQKLNEAKSNLSTQNASVKEIIIETYRNESELQEKLMNRTGIALKDLRG